MSRMMVYRNATLHVAGLLLLSSLVGCQTSGLTEWSPFHSANEPTQTDPSFVADEFEPVQPARMAVIWKDSAVSQPGQPAVRGFGGRVYFYNEEDEPVRVHGDLTVYAFDDSQSEIPGALKSSIPDRKYVFKKSDLQKHYSETGMGPSYSIWIPWDVIGGYRKTVSLLPVFKPENGLIVKAGQSIAVLPGKDPYAMASTMDSEPGSPANVDLVRQTSGEYLGKHTQALAAQVSHEETINEALSANSFQERVTTINVPRGMRDRINQGGMIGGSDQPDANARFDDRDTTRDMGLVRRDIPMSAEPQSVAVQPTDRTRPVFGQPGAFR